MALRRVFAMIAVLAACGGAGFIGGLAWRAGHGVRREAVALPPPDWLAGSGVAVATGAGTPVLRIFGDYECPACRDLERFAGDSLRALARAGRIRFVYHHAPLRAHRRGPLAAAAAYCAADSRLAWAAHRVLYETAADWSRRAAGFESTVAAAAGVADCMASGRAAQRVARDRAIADRLGVRVVPTVLLDDARLEFTSFRALLRYVTQRATSIEPAT